MKIMRYVFYKVVIVLLILSSECFGQSEENIKIGLYQWSEVVIIKRCDIHGVDLSRPDSLLLSKVGQKFRVISLLDNGFAVIKILDYTNIRKNYTSDSSRKKAKFDLPVQEYFQYNYLGSDTSYFDEKSKGGIYYNNQAYFKIKVKVIDDCAVKETRIGGSFAAGVINFPFKYRPQKGNTDFSGAFNFGAGLGYTFAHKTQTQFTQSIISGYSISNIILDSASTIRNQGELASTNNFTAFSFSIGYVIEYQKVQAGLFLGIDMINKINQKQFGWQYQNKPWISVGLGVAIFSGEKEKPAAAAKN